VGTTSGTLAVGVALLDGAAAGGITTDAGLASVGSAVLDVDAIGGSAELGEAGSALPLLVTEAGEPAESLPHAVAINAARTSTEAVNRRKRMVSVCSC
jgi:hypothetical protein